MPYLLPGHAQYFEIRTLMYVVALDDLSEGHEVFYSIAVDPGVVHGPFTVIYCDDQLSNGEILTRCLGLRNPQGVALPFSKFGVPDRLTFWKRNITIADLRKPQT